MLRATCWEGKLDGSLLGEAEGKVVDCLLVILLGLVERCALGKALG